MLYCFILCRWSSTAWSLKNRFPGAFRLSSANWSRPACACSCYGIAIIGVLCSSAGIVSSREYYTSEFNITESSMRFGLVTGFRLDVQYLVFGTPKAKAPEIEPSQLLPVDDPENSSSIISSEVKPVEYDSQHDGY